MRFYVHIKDMMHSIGGEKMKEIAVEIKGKEWTEILDHVLFSYLLVQHIVHVCVLAHVLFLLLLLLLILF